RAPCRHACAPCPRIPPAHAFPEFLRHPPEPFRNPPEIFRRLPEFLPTNRPTNKPTTSRRRLPAHRLPTACPPDPATPAHARHALVHGIARPEPARAPRRHAPATQATPLVRWPAQYVTQSARNWRPR